MPNAPRSAAERKADTLAMLSTPAIDVWVATASEGYSSPHPHLVPLSLGWIDERVVIAVEASSVTARNITTHRRARLAIGSDSRCGADRFGAPPLVVDGRRPLLRRRRLRHAGRLGSPRVWRWLRLPRVASRAHPGVPHREANEIAGRTSMCAGRWLV